MALLALATACAAEAPAESPAALADEHADEQAVRARLSACAGTPFLFTIGALSAEPFLDSQGEVEACVAAAPDCPAVTACLGLNEPCTGDNRCESTTAVRCAYFDRGLSAELRTDCTNDTANPFCDVVDVGTGPFAICNAGPCAGDRCDDNVAVRCSDSVEVREPCGPNRRCVTGSTGVFCAEPHTCTRDHCQGNSVAICRDGFVEATHDCTTFVADGYCQDDSGTVDCRSPPHPDCPADEPFTEGCDGDDGYACYVGARYRIACSEFGGGCAIDELGQSHCVGPE